MTRTRRHRRGPLWAAAALGLAFALHAGGAHALVGGPAPGAATPTTLKLPDGPASVQGLNDKATVEVFSGQIGYSVALDLPRGRAGFGPSLALTYSGDLGNGPLGVGWTIGTIAIRRSLRHGVPSYTDADEFELVGIGGGGRLVRDGRPGSADVYWVEGQGTSIRVERRGVRWEVRDASGSRYLLGVTEASRLEEEGRIAAWFVDTTMDLVGQVVRFEYLRDHRQIYPRRIIWGPEEAFRVDFVYEAGTRYDETISFRTGFDVRTSKRLERIEVWVFDPQNENTHVRQRVYELEYDSSLALSRLQAVVVRGRDRMGVRSVLTLPRLSLGYAQPEPATVATPSNTGAWVLNERGTNLFDVDGDGMADLLRLEHGSHHYRKNLGDRFADPRPLTGASDTDLDSVQLMDVDGDARADLVRIVDDTWRVYRLEGDAWQSRGEWPGTRNMPFNSKDTVIGDVNGDGRMDVLRASADNLLVHFNGRSSLGEVKRVRKVSAVDTQVEPGQRDVRWTDYNGDGLLDAVWMTDAWMKVFLGRGDGTFFTYNRPGYPWGHAAIDVRDIHLADLNRDGLTDIIRFTAGHVLWFPGRADGTFTLSPRNVVRPEGVAFDAVVAVADANGNGSQDIVWSSGRGLWVLDLAGTTSAGMLATIDNGLGQHRTISYAASAQLAVQAELTGSAWERKLPVSIAVPIRVEVDPGGGGPPRVVHYGVRDGFWDGEERRFGGFLEASQSIAGLSAASTSRQETRFLPGLGSERVLRGKTSYAKLMNARGDVFVVSKHDWEAMALAALPDHPWLRRAVERTRRSWNHEGVTVPVEALSIFDFDEEGRPTLERHLGRLDRTDDQKVVRRRFQSDGETWVRDRLCDESLFEADAQGIDTRLVSKTINTYGDHQADASRGADANCGVGKGWLRKVQGFLRKEEAEACGVTTDDNLTLRLLGYDSFGNVVSTKDGGVERTIGFDSRRLRAVRESVQPTQGKVLAFEVSWEEVLGQPTTLTDTNGDVMRVGYDDLGRQISVAANNRQPHLLNSYKWEVNPPSIPTPRTFTYTFDRALDDPGLGTPPNDDTQPPPAGWRQRVAVVNGAGEDLYTATRLEPQKWILNGWKERDNRGHVTVVADPFYFDGTTLPTTRPASFAPFQTVEYDALERMSRQRLPNEAEKTFAYRAFEQTLSASDLQPVQSTLDGLGRIRRTHRSVDGVLEEVDAQYDAADRIVSMSLQQGAAVHQFTYDTLGRLTFATDPDIGPRRLCYNSDGLLISHKNGQDQVIGFAYDGAGRLTARGPGSVRFGTEDVLFTYDSFDPRFGPRSRTNGRLASVREPNGQGQVAFAYDELGRQLLFARDVQPPGAAKVSAWEETLFGASGLLISKRAGDGFALKPKYDAAGRLTELEDIWRAGPSSEPGLVNGLDAAGRIGFETYGNGVKQEYKRDLVGLSKKVSVLSAATPQTTLFAVEVLERNKYGAPTNVADLVAGGTDQAAQYGYDGAARLVRATLGATAVTRWEFSYRYDGLQNMIARRQTGPDPNGIGILSGYYRHGEIVGGEQRGPRQLTSVLHRDCPGDATIFDYDKAGRLVKEGQKALAYDPYDQLTSVTLPGTGVVSYTYAYDGLKTSAKLGSTVQEVWFTSDHTLVNGERVHYVSVSDRLIARLNFDNVTTDPPSVGPLAWPKGMGERVPAFFAMAVAGACGILFLGSLRRRRRPVWVTAPACLALACHVLALSGCAHEEVSRQSLERASQRKYFHQGLAAGPSLVTSNTGTISDERRFEPFGHPINANLAVDPRNSLNKETDPQTKWSYHGARWMAPQTARWTAPDPPVKAPNAKFMAAPWELHPYQYANQNPSLFWDPSGQESAAAALVGLQRDPNSNLYIPPERWGNGFYPAPPPVSKGEAIVAGGVIGAGVALIAGPEVLAYLLATGIGVEGVADAVQLGLSLLDHYQNPNLQSLSGIGMAAVDSVSGPNITAELNTIRIISINGRTQRMDSIPPALPDFDGKTTRGVLITWDAHPIVAFTRSGRSATPRQYSGQAAGHSEGRGAIVVRDKDSVGGTFWHNNYNGTCGYCNSGVITLLPPGRSMFIVPPRNAVPNNSRAVAVPKTYTGNSNEPAKCQ